MVSLNITEEQAAVLATTDASVVLRGPRGDVLGIVSRGMALRTLQDEQAFVLRMKDRAKEDAKDGLTTEELLRHLHQLG